MAPNVVGEKDGRKLTDAPSGEWINQPVVPKPFLKKTRISSQPVAKWAISEYDGGGG